MHLSKWNFLSL